MTEIVLKNGDIAIATLRKPSALDPLVAQYPPAQLLVLELDVTQPAAIARAFSKAQEVFGRIDVVFNNAGLGLGGEMEGTPDDAAHAVFDVNFWGAVSVTREAIRFFREVNHPMGGRLLQMGSMTGIDRQVMGSFYSASKHALEGFSKSVAAELDPTWNIKITLLEPGFFHTSLASNTALMAPHPAYVGPTSKTAPLREYVQSTGKLSPGKYGDTEKGMSIIYRLAQLPDPPLQFPLGKDVIEIARGGLANYGAILDQYGPWSDGVEEE